MKFTRQQLWFDDSAYSRNSDSDSRLLAYQRHFPSTNYCWITICVEGLPMGFWNHGKRAKVRYFRLQVLQDLNTFGVEQAPEAWYRTLVCQEYSVAEGQYAVWTWIYIQVVMNLRFVRLMIKRIISVRSRERYLEHPVRRHTVEK